MASMSVTASGRPTENSGSVRITPGRAPAILL
jgi:hypothetical protein